MDIRCCHSLRDEAGFSLIEVLVAMALLGVSASVLVGTQIAAVRSSQLESLRSEALGVAQAVAVLRLALPSRVCGDAVASSVGFEVSDGLCASSICSGNACAARVESRAGELLWGRDER